MNSWQKMDNTPKLFFSCKTCSGNSGGCSDSEFQFELPFKENNCINPHPDVNFPHPPQPSYQSISHVCFLVVVVVCFCLFVFFFLGGGGGGTEHLSLQFPLLLPLLLWFCPPSTPPHPHFPKKCTLPHSLFFVCKIGRVSLNGGDCNDSDSSVGITSQLLTFLPPPPPPPHPSPAANLVFIFVMFILFFYLNVFFSWGGGGGGGVEDLN